MASEVSLYIQSKKRKDDFIFVNFYTGSCPIFNPFDSIKFAMDNDRLGDVEIIPDEDENKAPYYELTEYGYNYVKNELSTKKTEIEERRKSIDNLNSELMHIASISIENANSIVSVNAAFEGYLQSRYEYDDDYDMIVEEERDLTRLWNMYKSSTIQDDGIRKIFFSIG